MLLIFVTLGAAPSIFLLVFFYLKDRYEPEPRGHVALAFLKGALAVIPAYLVASAIELAVGRQWLVLGGFVGHLFEAGVMAAGVEELFKWLVFWTFVYRWNELDEPLDGVVYGVALALGFATIENMLCVTRDGLQVGVLRAIFAVPAHALFGAGMGFYFGRAKLGAGQWQGIDVTRAERRRRLLAALAVPMVFHAGYDLVLIEFRGPWMYGLVGVLSAMLWFFVLQRVHVAQRDSPFRKM